MPLCVALTGTLNAAEITATDAQGKPMATVMVSRYLAEKPALDLRDDGYPPDGAQNQAAVEHTLLSIAAGVAEFADLRQTVR